MAVSAVSKNQLYGEKEASAAMKLRTSGEDYLEAILVLQKEKREVRPTDLAEYLGVSKPSVSRAVSLLRQGGFLKPDGAFLEFTAEGRNVAEKTYEKHCFFKAKLMEAGIDEQTAEREACQMEHALSEESFAKLKSLEQQEA